MTSTGDPVRHPVLAALEVVNTALAEAAGLPVWSLSAGECDTALDGLHAAQARLAGLGATLIGQGVNRMCPEAARCRDTAEWLQHRHRHDRRDAKALVAFAAAVTGDRDQTRDALAAGQVSVQQARAVVAAVSELPAGVTAAQAASAEEFLLAKAAELDPAGLRVCGRAITEHLTQISADGAPPAAEPVTSRVRLRPRDGGWALTGWLAPYEGNLLAAALDTRIEHTRRQEHAAAKSSSEAEDDGVVPADGDGDRLGEGRGRDEYRARALVDLLTAGASAPDPDPGTGPVRPQVTVLIPLATLTERLGGATLLDTGQALSPETARRLACDADLIPAVLGAKGQVLDVGRAKRQIPTALRTAVAIRDGGCTFPACTRAPGSCEAHHIRHWSHGGPTDYQNLTLLCGRHHQLAHDQGWQITRDSHGLPLFTPPPTIDPLQRPRQHHRYPLRQ
jgi:hypothetical protein